METQNHLALEREIVAELGPVTQAPNQPRTVRRDTVLSILSQSAQTSTDFGELLNEACLLAAMALDAEFFGHAQVLRTGSLTTCWGSVTDSNRHVSPVPSEVPWDSSCSAFGFALEAGHPILVGDVQEEMRFCDPMLIAQGIQWGAICPIIYRAQQYGAIGVFCTDRCPIAKEDVLFLQSVALLLGPTRAHQKTERSLAEHSRFPSTAIDSLDAIVVLLDATGAVLQINHACQSWGGFSADQLFGRKLWSAFFLPGEEESIRELIQEAASGASQRRRDAYFLSKHGDRRRVSWTVARLPSAAGDATFLATGIDVTEQHNAMTMLQEMKANLTEAAKLQSTNASGLAKGAKTEEEKGRERRKHDRRPYSCVQLIGPCIGGSLPERKDFREVRCHDISPRGFSFLLEAKPDFDELVVAFGAAQSELFLRAKVKHISSIHHIGRIYMKIGCEYLGRVRLPSAAEKAKAS